MIATTVYHRYASGGCGWHIADDDSQTVLADGYTRTLLGARWAVARRRAWWWLRYTPGQISYAIRPYDMLADRRRWFFQRPERCLSSRLLALCDCPHHPCMHNPAGKR